MECEHYTLYGKISKSVTWPCYAQESCLCLHSAAVLMSLAAAAKSRQLCPTLCDPIDGSPPGSCPWPTLHDPMDCSLPRDPAGCNKDHTCCNQELTQP